MIKSLQAIALAILFACAGQKSSIAAGDIVGKTVVGYQGWFACDGDGSPVGTGLHRWTHWNGGTAPSPGHQSFEIWPDTREWGTAHTYGTGYKALGNGQPARLYASDDKFTVDTHVRWMREYGIDCAALQRFGGELRDPVFRKQRNEVAKLVQSASERNHRKFYIMYDTSGWNEFHDEITKDWSDTIVGQLRLTNSASYARQDGKPVVCIWGFGFSDREGNANKCVEVIKWFQSHGCYVIGGVPTYWRTSDRDSKPDYLQVYQSFDMIQPWAVGRFGTTQGAEEYATKTVALDLQFCRDHKIAYQPVVFPGFSWSNWNGGKRNAIPRQHGEFLWAQFRNLKHFGVKSAYVAMFDEFDEGTAIAKAAEDSSMAPTDQYFQTLEADGVKVSSDFYLRVVRDASRALHGASSMAEHCPVPFRP